MEAIEDDYDDEGDYHTNLGLQQYHFRSDSKLAVDYGQSREDVREQDRYLPIANIARIMKKVLPGNAKIAKDAKESIQECVSEFISFITSEASDKCQQEKRKTINGDDLLWAMSTLGFEKYIEPLKSYLAKYRESVKGDKGSEKKSSSTTIRRDFASNIQLPYQQSQYKPLTVSNNYESNDLLQVSASKKIKSEYNNSTTFISIKKNEAVNQFSIPGYGTNSSSIGDNSIIGSVNGGSSLHSNVSTKYLNLSNSSSNNRIDKK